MGRPLIIADPSDPNFGMLGRIARTSNDPKWRFLGVLNILRAPHLWLASLGDLLAGSPEDVVVVFPPYRAGPALRHLFQVAAMLVQPTEIGFASGTPLSLEGWPVGPSEVWASEAFPPTVVAAQRRAHWLKVLEDCHDHEVDLRKVSLEGARLGAGTPLQPHEMERAGLNPEDYAEVCGGHLLVVRAGSLPDEKIAKALDYTHAAHAHVIEPTDYEGLLCAVTRGNGEDFGFGVVRRFDVRDRILHLRANALPPAPIRTVKLGTLVLDEAGREAREIKPWQV